jgi:hypothetical protein
LTHHELHLLSYFFLLATHSLLTTHSLLLDHPGARCRRARLDQAPYSLHLTRPRPPPQRPRPPPHTATTSFTYGCRLYAQGLANVAPPLVLDTAAAAEQRPQQVGTRPPLRGTPRHAPASPGAVVPCHPCLLGPPTAVVLSCHPCLLGPPTAVVPSWERHSLAASPPRAGTAGPGWLGLGGAPHSKTYSKSYSESYSRGAAVPAPCRSRGRGSTRLGARC